MKTVGVILAGGRSRRFGRDKLLYKLRGGDALVGRVVEAFEKSRFISDVYFSTRSRSFGELLKDKYRKPYIIDLYDFEGPHSGILSALKTVEAEEYVFLPGDIPFIKYETIDNLVEYARMMGVDCASPIWRNGVIEALIIYCRSREVELLEEASKIKNMRPTDLHRYSRKLLLIGVSRLAEDPIELTNINRVGDIDNPKPRGEPCNRIRLVEDASEYYIEYLKSLISRDSERAVEYLSLEAESYINHEVYHLAYHALLDLKVLAPKNHPIPIDVLLEKMNLPKFHV